MYVIGTAGHVDHGKSTLVQALTGIHPDRLKEEREREMTIDLGFAWFKLPSGEEIGIVDVPGHRDFIENMLAGVGGIDAALFVIAADEGVMPQTREHLAILNLLEIQGGVVALTKTDLVEQEWLEIVHEDVQQTLNGTILQNAPIIPVSARTHEGLSQLSSAISACLADRPQRPDYGRPRLPIDRVFTIPGFGTVVTGTLSDGKLELGDEIEILPNGLHGRIRGLQTHKHKENKAKPGSRTAVNVSGIAVDQIKRGDILARPGTYQASRRFDAKFRLLPEVSSPLKHDTEVKLYIGAMETIARVRLLGSDELLAGEHGWLQLELVFPAILVRGDRFILRRPSPGETLGGGVVVDPFPKGRHKRFSEQTLQNLDTMARGSPAELLLQTASSLGAASLRVLLERSNLDPKTAQKAAHALLNEGLLYTFDNEAPITTTLSATQQVNLDLSTNVISKYQWDSLASKTINVVNNYHQLFPLRSGIPREELRSRLKTSTQGSPKLFNFLIAKLIQQGELEEQGNTIRLAGRRIELDHSQEQIVERLLTHFLNSPYSPPSVKEVQAEIDDELYRALLGMQVLIEVNSEVVFRKVDYDQMVREIRKLIEQNGAITAAQVRDHFKTSRKYSLGLLEHLDLIGVTLREGDYRRLRRDNKG